MVEPQVGDAGLVRGDSWVAWWIRFGTRSEWAHVVIYVGYVDGQKMLAEAMPEGMQLAPYDKYPEVCWLTDDPVIDGGWTREKIAIHAGLFVKEKRGYGWLDIFSVACLQFHFKPWFIRKLVERSDRLICSQAFDFACSLSGVQLFDDGRLPMDVTPQDLAARYTAATGKDPCEGR